MSWPGNRFGGQCPSHPLTVRDKAILFTIGFVIGALIVWLATWLVGVIPVMYAAAIVFVIGCLVIFFRQKGGA